ncbi:MAG TPA: hypothetical protein VLZ89_07230 [Anaerolineales bacterium]|nr:hypothetical protein [Anaerolineales bacterium]
MRKRVPWEVIPALAVGIGLGLLYAWMIAPVRYLNTFPNTLRPDFKDQYRILIAASYSATHDLVRAKSRLGLLGDADPVQALTALAQRLLASGQPFEVVQQVAMLADDLKSGVAHIPPTATAASIVSAEGPSATPPAPPAGTEAPPASTTESPTLEAVTTVVPITITPRPTPTATATEGAPFLLLSDDKVCNPNLTDGLLQISVIDSRHHQMPGIEIIITWDGGEEHFFTGFKPEIANGYADYIMQSGLSYSVRIAASGTPVPDLTAPICTDSSGQAYTGGLHLTFQQP